ncbi:glycoside hydrolase family 28 protein [Candidatus Sumerlaeota bacterium]|nr:glycoside hydrolase family 28 protein [Candidatus Sumerlaeota bacterium]
MLWEKPELALPGISYIILSDDESVCVTTKTHFTVKGLSPDTEYVFSVLAKPEDGDSVRAGNPLTVRTKAKESVVSILDHGAVGDGTTLNTRAIQAAIDACPAGGVIRIPEGVFLSGALFLKSGMTLEIAEGGVLKGSADPEDYEPFIRNRFEGWELETYASLLNAGALDSAGPANVRNISIRGKGTISGGGQKLGAAMQDAHGFRSRGRLICLMNAENIEVQGLTLEETPCWTLHYIYSENVSCHGLTFKSVAHNGDGIDPDSSRNSFIFNCVFTTSDDCIAIKSGKNPEGNVVNRPTENVRVFDCRFTEGCGISIGSEMSGGVRNVLIEDCVAGNLRWGLQIKGTKDRGGFVENVTVRDCGLRLITIYSDVYYNNDGEPAPEQPYYRNFRFENIDLTKGNASEPVIQVNGFPAEGHQTRDVIFENISLPEGSAITVDRAKDIVFSNITTTDGKKPAYTITQSENVAY